MANQNVLGDPVAGSVAVGNMLNRPYGGTDVPMPHPDLKGFERASPPQAQPYLRADDHGGVLGVSVPFLHKRRSGAP